jgi:D-alanine-D-alanine ligase-like ATP-grasp enzyme
LAAALHLSVAGIDLRKTPEGEWVCFEVNTSPAFTYYEEATGQPIAHAIAELLASAEA